MKNRSTTLMTILPLLTCFALLPRARAVSPAPDGCYPNFTTAEGCDALKSLSGGAGNTALGWRSLFLDSTGSFNTGVGAGALILNNGESNTAVGAVALLLNSTGSENTAVGTQTLLYNDASYNTAAGASALFSNTTGDGNTATGNSALQSNTGGAYNTAVGIQSLVFNDTGSDNTAVGAFALFANEADGNTAMGYSVLFSNSTGSRNTAVGNSALFFNTSGSDNTAVGAEALYSNSNGFYNVAIGGQALYSNTGSYNVAIGLAALNSNTSGANVAIGSAALAGNTTGYFNTAIGDFAGSNHETGDGNVYIGQDVFGGANENDTTYIRNIYFSTANARQVYVNSDNKVGTLSSSRRYKENIEPMNKASEALFALKPVTFRYKKEIDRSGLFCFGLIAEEVAQISPDLVTRDGNGQPESVRYDAVNAMLLNEFLKEHKKVEEQQAVITKLNSTVALQQKHIESLAAGLRKVSAHLELRQAAPQVATNLE